MEDQTASLIRQLSSLSFKLSSGSELQNARTEALRLSRLIAAGLEPPETVSLDLAYSVRPCIHLFSLSFIICSKMTH